MAKFIQVQGYVGNKMTVNVDYIVSIIIPTEEDKERMAEQAPEAANAGSVLEISNGADSRYIGIVETLGEVLQKVSAPDVGYNYNQG